jgi:hypothetical protein
MKKQYAPAFKHEPIEPLLDNTYWVHGSVKMAPAMYMNRNMIIIKEGEELILINPIRLISEEEKRLKAMGKVKAIIRLGDFHGLDDQYYVDTFGGAFWCQPKQTTYPFPKADHEISPQAKPPIAGAEFFIFSTALYPESALLLRDKKLLITCDSIQYWTDWQHMTRTGKALLWMMGFRTGLFIGKPWLKRVSPKEKSLQSDFNKLLELDFEHLIAAHGKPLLNVAKEKVSQIVANQFTSLK